MYNVTSPDQSFYVVATSQVSRYPDIIDIAFGTAPGQFTWFMFARSSIQPRFGLGWWLCVKFIKHDHVTQRGKHEVLLSTFFVYIYSFPACLLSGFDLAFYNILGLDRCFESHVDSRSVLPYTILSRPGACRITLGRRGPGTGRFHSGD